MYRPFGAARCLVCATAMLAAALPVLARATTPTSAAHACAAPAALQGAPPAQPPAGGPIVMRAGGYTVRLTLPPASLHAGPIAMRVQVAVAQGGGLPAGFDMSARLVMPEMPDMALEAPGVRRGPAPGDFVIDATAPHAGEYQLDLGLRRPGGRTVEISFPLTVTGAAPGGGMAAMMKMMAPFAGISPMQEGSGTGWQPAATPMFGIHWTSGRWALMAHYNVFLDYDRQEGPRGGYKYNSLNWGMLMADRSVGRDRLELRTMLTLEPLTTTPGGYPLLFQSGEQYHGSPLVDRQHPHDLFMELAARYTHPVGRDSAVFAYAAPSGEPALGPEAFMHRLSAFDNPMAPITHHWMDSTHVDFGVLTLGAWKRSVQIEGSYFTGREPDEYRYDFYPFDMNSFSGRLSYNPGRNWATQVSYGWLHSPEVLRPQEDVRRTTASAIYTLPRHDGGYWAATLAYGNNNQSGGINSNGFLAESELSLALRHTLFTRFEYVDKLGEELALTPADTKFGLTETTLGYVYDFTPNRPYQTGIGSAVTFNTHPASLDSLYGRSPMGFWIFLRIRPAPMRHRM